MNAVELLELCNLHQREVFDPLFPSSLSAWSESNSSLNSSGTHFGYVHSGTATLHCSSGDFRLTKGMYFSVPGPATIEGSYSSGFVATRRNFNGFFQIGGPIETVGRLKYIDGCSDSLLIGPPVIGDPCLNLLVLPPGTEQTEHVHPSCRVGIIADGSGLCRTPDGDHQLRAGMLFNIGPNAKHSFHTRGETLRVIAWHPDTDCGPNHHDHPMINRTIIDGKSASIRNQPAASGDFK